MIDSTARAQRFEADSTPSPAYLWAPPQKPVSVSIPLGVIDQLEREAVDSFRSLSSRGSEIGGLLFGTVQPGSPLIVSIESYESVDCDYSSGPLYRLGEAERARLDRAIEQRLSAGVKAVGFYRSHTRKGLYLDADDLALFDSRFTDAHHFALLIRPAATKVSMAGIFIREDGKVQAEASCLEFPFRSSQHDSNRRADSLYDGAVAGPRSVTAAPAPPRPVIRAQIVPIASRREMAAETPQPPSVENTPAAPEPAAATPPARPESLAAGIPPAPAPARGESTPVPDTSSPAQRVSVPTAETKRSLEPPAPAPTVPEPASAPEAALAPPAEAVRQRSGKLLWVSLGAAVPLILLVGFFFSSGILHRRSSVPGAAQDASPLSLRVDRNGADIVLTWNRDSDAIKAASRAVLSISDGAQHENVDMDLAQLKNGSIVYSPVTSDVVFRMEVSGSDQTKTLSESVRVLRTRPSPMGDPAEQAKTQTPSSPANAGAAPAADAPAVPTPAEEEKVTLAQAVKPFKAESLAQRLHTTASAEMPDAPAIGAPAASSNVNLGNLMSTQAAPPPTAVAPAAVTPVSPAALPEKKNVGGQIQQAVLLKRKDPEYPKLARESGAGGIVEVVAIIGADGHVKSAQVVKGHPLLRQAAIDAVKGWVYRPTILNGVAVEAQTQVLLNFKADR